MLSQAHSRLFDHPVLHWYASMCAFGQPADHGEAAASELQGRTPAGARVLCLGATHPHRLIALARRRPEHHFVVVEPEAGLAAQTRALAAEHGLSHVDVRDGQLEEPPTDGPAFAAAVTMHSVHRSGDLARLWSRLRARLAAGAVVLAQEYVGPAGFEWPRRQRDAAQRFLAAFVPTSLKPHHATLEDVDAELRRATPAPQSDQLLARCSEAGFELLTYAEAGGPLLTPVLAGQEHAYLPANWQHNRVLGALFRADRQLVADDVCGADWAMFIARRGDDAR